MTLDILVGCEESQAVCIELRKLGHNAFSCDLEDCSGGHPEWHLKMDIFEAIKLKKWHMLICFPPCTFMSRAGARWMYPQAGKICRERLSKAMEAKVFFMNLLNADIQFIALENPLPLKIIGLPKESQVIQPYEYGHPFSKRTHLWLKELPQLHPTEIRMQYEPFLPSNTGGAKRNQKASPKNLSQKDSSKTFKGIAVAMAEQWTKHVLETTL
jgi:hypothetical protein